ncbi:SusC/RagA family TonB-linked outer membrane protein [Aridibaculum aurantiacum]|uniref:SusC/RagA family TonB-linked outer membrane protein n=1 Tax=Aridibaculum aurantiacum TaxID=2810307 RepID=UPI001A95C930|nr:TonB-dependent receptor [Aridibaculum aurantiacum]
MRRLLLFIFCIALAGIALAQTRTVTGIVTDEKGVPLANASVLVRGTTTGVNTDVNGRFSIAVPSNARVLVISSVGYGSQELTLSATTNEYNAALQSTAERLDEVVVVGYGQQAARRVTTSIATIKGDEIRNLPVAELSQAIQGRVAGVQISAGSGRPGAPIAVNVRGRSSIQAGNNPLYVIDGLILASNNNFTPSLGTVASQAQAGAGISPLANINPDDIESIEVLKDAAAAAIYGSRGSNGVVLITTKRGSRSNRSQVSLTSFYGFQSLTTRRDVLNASEYRQLYNEARVNTGLTPLFTQSEIDNPPANVNWLDEILNKNSAIVNTQVAVSSGGDRKTQIYASLGYLKQDGPLIKGDFSRYSGRFNLDHSVTDRLKIGNSSGIARTRRSETPVDNSIFSPFPRSLIARPDQPIYNPDGKFAVNDFNNPVQMFLTDNFVNLLTLQNLTYGEYNIIPGLRFRSSLGVDYTVLDQRIYNPTTSLVGQGSQGTATQGAVTTQNYILTQNLNYNKMLLDNRLSLDATAVYEYQYNKREDLRVDAQNFASDVTPYIVSAAQITTGSSTATDNALASVLGRVNLGWRNKYLFGASIRRDGSSKFPREGRYGVFPALSAAWNITEETFMDNVRPVSFLKLRASYGETGNQEGIANFASRRLFGTGFNYNDQPGFALAAYGNPNLRWETTTQYDIGLDVGLFNDRLRITADYYRKNTKDLLINRPVPRTSGFAAITENIGSLEASGWDFLVTGQILNQGLKWSSTLNFNTYNNKVTALYNNQPIPGTFATQIAVGQPLGAFFLIKALGVDPATGDMLYENVNAPATIGGEDRQFLGSPIPDFYGGLTNNFSYKGFDLSAFVQFSVGNMIYNNAAEGTGGYGSLGANVSATGAPTNVFREIYQNRWVSGKTDAKYPRAVGGPQGAFNTQRSSRFLEDGSYARLKNITLGYNLPSTVLRRMGMSNLRLYVSGQNLLTWTKYSGFDPEVSTDFTVNNAGVDQGAIPQMKTVTVGLNVNF